MNKQTNKVERQVMNLLSYWAARRRDIGFIFMEHPWQGTSQGASQGTSQGTPWETCQETIFISGRRFDIIYTQIGQAIWTKVLVQEQGSGRIHTARVPPVTRQESKVPSQDS